tara:strand:- start:1096 stop:1302 length:207 start_codon:yes stop_codon:yes gene_type:complete
MNESSERLDVLQQAVDEADKMDVVKDYLNNNGDDDTSSEPESEPESEPDYNIIVNDSKKKNQKSCIIT